MATTTNVTAAKPPINGAVSVAPLNTTLPTSAEATLGDAFKNLGYISEDGITENVTREHEEVNAWGGDEVLSSQTKHSATEVFTLIEAINIDVLKTVFGDANVSGALSTGITVNCNSAELEAKAWVIDTVLRNGVLQRTVIPNGKVVEVAEVQYNDSNAVGYAITINCMPDSTTAHNKFIRYIKTPTPPSPPGLS